MTDITSKPAYKIIELIKTKTISSEEVTKAFIKKINEVNPKLNAVVQFNEELALQQAKQADQKLNKGEPLAPLHGLPITIKDTVNIYGYKNSYGSHLYDNYIPLSEGTCITRLRKAGVVILGITNSPELLTAYESDNLIYGRTNNPYDLTRTSGGSSGGEAAIIAANGSPFGLGTDGGGSIRIPAHYCGIAGIKPTQGLIPLTGMALTFGGPGCLQAFGSFGPMARYVDDLILGLSVLHGPDEFDPGVPPVNLGDHNTVDISKLKIAYFTDNGIVTPSKDIIDAVLDAVAIFSDLGAIVTEAKPKGIDRTFELLWETFFNLSDAGLSVINQLKDLPINKISSLRRQFHAQAKNTDLTTTELNLRFSEIIQFKCNTYIFLNEYDLIICPPCATTAKLHGKCFDEIKDFTYSMSFNITGSPAVVVPFTKSVNGLPIGVQIVANLWKDHVALAAAKVLESTSIFHRF